MIEVNGKPIDYERLLEPLRRGMKLYIEEGILPGDFLQAVLRNDLKDAVGRADFWNLRMLPQTVNWLRDCAPGDCHGSRAKVEQWCAVRRSQPELLV
jgi:hypothetical protein